MKIVGIIVEYNPFHNGHLYQINEIKKQLQCDKIVVVMSGNFAQRGIPCITDKYTRAQMALACGVDLVLELPLPFATASAQWFAEAAIGILHHTNIVDTLCFGSEFTDLSLMHLIAETLLHEPAAFSSVLKVALAQGQSYPRARQTALIEYLKSTTPLNPDTIVELENLLSHPNTILGIEYIRALLKYNSPIKPFTIKRESAHYHDPRLHEGIASATAIRQAFASGKGALTHTTLPPMSYELLQSTHSTCPLLSDFSDLIHYKIIFSTLDDLYAIWDVPKNLMHSIYNAFQSSSDLGTVIDMVTSKTYSRATVQRALLRILLSIQSTDIETLASCDWTPHIRVLACHKDSKNLLAHLCKSSSVPVITQLGKSYPTLSPLSKMLIDYEIRATEVFALQQKNPSLAKSDFTASIFPR